jgi:hypothetical protein
MKAKPLSGVLSIWPIRIVSSSESSFAFFICILALTFAYRIQLMMGLLTTSARPFDFNPALHWVSSLLAYFPYEYNARRGEKKFSGAQPPIVIKVNY